MMKEKLNKSINNYHACMKFGLVHLIIMMMMMNIIMMMMIMMMIIFIIIIIMIRFKCSQVTQ